MVRIRVRVGPKGQIVIPKVLREAYRIREGEYVFLEPSEQGLMLRGTEPPSVVLEWIRERRDKLRAKGARTARLGELADIDLEEEFEE